MEEIKQHTLYIWCLQSKTELLFWLKGFRITFSFTLSSLSSLLLLIQSFICCHMKGFVCGFFVCSNRRASLDLQVKHIPVLLFFLFFCPVLHPISLNYSTLCEFVSKTLNMYCTYPKKNMEDIILYLTRYYFGLYLLLVYLCDIYVSICAHGCVSMCRSHRL